IPNFLAIPRIVPPPCSYSRRICSNSSTLALLSTRPPLGRLSPKRSTRYMVFSKVGPNQSIEWGQIRISKPPIVDEVVFQPKLSGVERFVTLPMYLVFQEIARPQSFHGNVFLLNIAVKGRCSRDVGWHVLEVLHRGKYHAAIRHTHSNIVDGE